MDGGKSQAWICQTCGTQYAPSAVPPTACRICQDDRQYVGWTGQHWTTLSEMQRLGYRDEFRTIEPDLFGIGTRPPFGIGHRALLVRTPAGNVLWDAVSYIDAGTIRRIESLGGIAALSASHPHFYSSIVEFSRAFGNAPIYLPRADQQWVARLDPAMHFYNDMKEILPGITLIQCGGHFPGSAVLHWSGGASGRGALLVGDTMAVAQDRAHVSFMYSFPNLLPLPADAVYNIAASVSGFEFERIYGGWWGRNIIENASEVLHASAEKYVRHLTMVPHQGTQPHPAGRPSEYY